MSNLSRGRPLSPHLQVYKLIPTMLMSIMHRITGAAMYFGTVLLAWWLWALSSGPSAFAQFQTFMGYWFFKIIILGYTWALIHHTLSGIRHLIWDMGFWFDTKLSTRLARANVVFSFLLVGILWFVKEFYYR
ncbi:Succinate dehydrogenase cytochrome b-556 subunit [Liberibacter crescens BT-1]|uniref:Succinate dehydrogenase cytochrome b556 subunit n=1 Tax=Liberibacter crescens (strain BT-1) TaxID=1215343 RepID=L0EVP3_LIBCB|nr:succinate dehydrogenase, cytochrome b556 subunit [Liberibacter crescens]AGA64743.1 Succinate dehydrogenase cytochrome b-556 subunit [Liberibacter crescens BT-1]AMC12825.1 succinate dehydrogenase [Liberibacter crescens]